MDSLNQQFLTRDCSEDTDAILSDRGSVTGLPARPGVEETDDRLTRLVRTIEAEIIPRLLLAHRSVPVDSAISGADLQPPGPDDVAKFTELVLETNGTLAWSYLDGLRTRGTPVETIYLHLLAPVARRLGELWEADLCDFAQVTLGLGRLQQVLRELSPTFRNEVECRDHGRRVLFTPAPGEQHTFGLCMVAEFFLREGWDVWGGPAKMSDSAAVSDDVVSIVRSEWFNLVGFSVATDTRLSLLSGSIRAIRRASRNRSIGVMVGGPIFIRRPELVALVGADATAVDAREAFLRAQSMFPLPAQRD